jgi:beta-lactamase regulating signal transducer with metallopeptidase domain
VETFGTTLQPFLAWLLETTLVASVVICLILVLQKLLGRRLGPRWSHALWLVLLLRMVLPWTPASPISLFRLIPASLQRNAVRETTNRIPREKAFGPIERAGTTEGTPATAPLPAESPAEPTKLRPHEIAGTAGPSIPLLMILRRMLPVLWLAGAILLGGYLAASNFALWRIVKREHPLINQEILELFEECKSQMDVQTIVALVPNDQVRSAALFGFVRPRLLLPREMIATASPEELRYIFLHELAHLKRHDIYLGWLTSLLQVLHWFNPLVWLAFYRMRGDRELACDALVLTRTNEEESQDYGRAIVALLRRLSRSRPLPAMAGILESRSQLKRRIAMIAQFRNNSYRWSPQAVILIVMLACVSLINAQQPGTSPQSASRRLGSAFSQELIADPNTQLEFRKVRGITGSKDVISMTYHGTHVDMSPNGRFLLYMDYMIPLADGDPRKLTNGDLGVGRVRWSPDGTMLAFYSDGGIWVMPISQETGEATGSAKRLVDGDYWYDFSVQWSPDSRKLVCRRPNGNLYVLSIQDGTSSQITTGNAVRRIQGGWSPDGKWIAYNQEDSSVWAVPSEGGQPRKLADVTGRGIPHWTPDGQWVLCQWNSRLRFIRFSDGLTADVTVPNEVGAFISWSPNNEIMLFYKPSYVWRDMLRVISASGGKPIVPDVSSTGNPTWTPDGRFIFTWGEYQDRYLYWVTPFGGGAASPYPLLLDRPYGYVPGRTTYAQESLSPSKEKLLFTTHTDSGQLEYWVVPISAPRGTSTGPAVKVFDKGPYERDACWSPDESKIALMYEGDLWIAQTDGSPPVKFTTASDRNVVRRAWSPDGGTISWISHEPKSGQSALRIRSLSGDQSREIASTSKRIRHLWSSDGVWIAYEFYEVQPERPDVTSTTRELFVVRAAGGEPRRLMEVTYDDHHTAFEYAWCPHGEQLALVCGRRLLLFDPAGGQGRQVSTLPDPTWGRCFDVQWSPDGKTLGLVLEARPDSTRGAEDTSGGTRLFTVTVPEGKWTELAGKAGTNYYCVWSPDGKWIAYNSEEWVRTRPEGILWEADVAPFLNRLAGDAAVSRDSK